MGIEYKKSVVPMAVAGRFLVEHEGGTGMVKVLAARAVLARSWEFIAIATPQRVHHCRRHSMVETEMCVSDVSQIDVPAPHGLEALREAI